MKSHGVVSVSKCAASCMMVFMATQQCLYIMWSKVVMDTLSPLAVPVYQEIFMFKIFRVTIICVENFLRTAVIEAKFF